MFVIMMHVKVSLALILILCEIYVYKVASYMKHSRNLSKILLTGSRLERTVNISPVELRTIFGREIFIKRDDWLTFPVDIGIRGNKIRKLQSLYDLGENFPRSVYSYGGNQSNAMRALALLCKQKDAKFTYFTRIISSHLKENPQGNFAAALDAGMKIVELRKEDLQSLSDITSLKDIPKSVLPESSKIENEEGFFVPQGAACSLAQKGVFQLCEEVNNFIQSSSHLSSKPWKIFFASGTGTCAYFANQYFNEMVNPCVDVEVVAIPCVTDEDGLKHELLILDKQEGFSSLPSILPTNNCQLKRRFGNIYLDYHFLWHKLCEASSIEFDLLYAPRAWEVIISQSHQISKDRDLQSLLLQFPNNLLKDWEKDYNLLYYHCGGIEGNPSLLSRYEQTQEKSNRKRK